MDGFQGGYVITHDITIYLKMYVCCCPWSSCSILFMSQKDIPVACAIKLDLVIYVGRYSYFYVGYFELKIHYKKSIRFNLGSACPSFHGRMIQCFQLERLMANLLSPPAIKLSGLNWCSSIRIRCDARLSTNT